MSCLLLLACVGMLSAAAPQRPRDPWVFRCVLDKQPRMVVIALHEDLWVAYDATTCSLYKVWQDGVKFDGAVYTTVHGPQPTSVGASLFEGPGGSVWTVHDAMDGLPKSYEADVQWRGYRLEGDSVWLHYEFAHEGLPRRIEESVEAIMENGKPVGIHRRFRQVGGHPGIAGTYWMTLALARGPQTALSQIALQHPEGDAELNVPEDTSRFAPRVHAGGDFEVRMYFRHAGE